MVNGEDLFKDLLRHHSKYIYVWLSLGFIFSILIGVTLLFAPSGELRPFLPTIIAAFAIIGIITFRQVRQEVKSIKKIKEIIKELK